MKKLRGERKQDALLDGAHRYCGVAAAIVGGAIIGGVASNAASSKASKAQTQAADKAGAISERQYDQTRADQLAQLAQQRADGAPYREAGYAALSQLSGGMAPGGEFNRAFDMNDIMLNKDPGYAFREQQGEQGINRAATASGSRYSGATLKALARFNSGLASQEAGAAYGRYSSELGNRFNRLSGLSGTGQTAVAQAGQAGQNAYGTIANMGLNNANAQGNAVQNAAAARASGYIGTANAFNGALQTGVNAYAQNQYMKQMAGANTPPPDYSTSYESSGYGGAGPLY